jgi:hypothetical protein
MATPQKNRPRTGEPRRRRSLLSVDLLPPVVLEAIKHLRAEGFTWPEIERLSELPYDERWKKQTGKHGFVDWAAMPDKVLAAFPKKRLPHTNLHRWYDLRVEQAQRDVMARAEQAREIAKEFAAAHIPGADEAVLNAARDVIFGMLQSTDDKSRAKASIGLIALAEVMQKARGNSIKERGIALSERRWTVVEKRMEQETESVAKKLNKGELTVEDINRLLERTFGLPPIAKAS